MVVNETPVTLKLDSVSVFEAVREQVGDWRLADHAFNPGVDEIAMSYDSGGSGRVALTLVFELDEAQMAAVLSAARPAG